MRLETINRGFKNFKNISLGMLIIVAFTLPFTPIRVHNILIVILGVSLFIHALIKGQIKNFTLAPFNRLPVGFILLQLIGLSYSDSSIVGLRTIETMVPLLVFPVVFGFNPDLIDTPRLRTILYAFVAGNVFTCLLLLSFLILQWNGGSVLDLINNTSHVKFSTLTHPTYLSLYISFCIFFLLDNVLTKHGRRPIKLVLIVFLCLMLIVINAKTSILSFVLVLILYSFAKLNNTRARGIALASGAIFVVLLFLYEPSRIRFFETPLKVIKADGAPDPYDQQTWSYAFRLQIYDCAIDQITKRFWIGYGTGASTTALMNCYVEKNYTWLIPRQLNAHNEYLETMLKHGVVGLILFLGLIGYPLLYAARKKYYVLAIFLILFALGALTENILSVQKGATFFGFFFTLLCHNLPIRTSYSHFWNGHREERYFFDS